MKVAIIHDWFLVKGGAEQVFKQIHRCFPDAEIFSLFNHLTPELSEEIVQNEAVTTSYLQQLPFSKHYHRYLLPFFRRAIESLDLSEYDLIISSSHAVAKGVQTLPGQHHICYCHTPIRYAWDLREQYMGQLRVKKAKRLLSWQLNKLRKWDYRVSGRVTSFIANSKYVAERIAANYNREAKVIYPPVDTDFFSPHESRWEEQTSYIVISRLVQYKRIDLVVEAFNRLPQMNLTIVGDGPELERLKRMANSNIAFTGFVDDTLVRDQLHQSKALILAANEDFGITSLEAQACGIPVIAFHQGGYLETVVLDKTGVFFHEQNSNSLIDALLNFEATRGKYKVQNMRDHALKFSAERFREEFTSFVYEAISARKKLSRV